MKKAKARKVGTSAKFREESEGLRSLSRGNAQTQSEGIVVRIEGIRKEGVERKTGDGVAIVPGCRGRTVIVREGEGARA